MKKRGVLLLLQIMLPEFREYIREQALLTSEQKVLLGVSGGIDSVVMAHLFREAGYQFGIAHCNFQLRGKEADEDEQFVRSLAKTLEAPYFSTSFKTEKTAKEKGISLQMAARKLRYTWFEQLRKENKYDYIAVATHRDDAIETFFINLARGTGISGLTGIAAKNGNIIRPLLFAHRKNIRDFARQQNIGFREDSSNKDTKYIRNKIRHELIPLFREINPDFESTMHHNLQNLSDAAGIFNHAIENARRQLTFRQGEKVLISIPELQQLPAQNTYLFELLKPFQFNPETVSDIANSLSGNPGRFFYSPSHRLLKDRDTLIIEPLKATDYPETTTVNADTSSVSSPLPLSFQVLLPQDFQLIKDPDIAALDYGKLQFPLILRKWKKGDRFQPLGMNGKKKLSDFFIDLKIPRNEKENTFVLISGKEIVWVVGLQINEKYKVAGNTKKIYLAKKE